MVDDVRRRRLALVGDLQLLLLDVDLHRLAQLLLVAVDLLELAQRRAAVHVLQVAHEVYVDVVAVRTARAASV